MLARRLLLFVVILGWGAVGSARAVSPDSAALEGTWLGTLALQSAELRVVFNIERTARGTLAATMDSPDQGATGIPVEQIRVTADTVRLGVPAIAGAFAGVIDTARQTIDGQWAQAGVRLPLVLRRVDEAPGVQRPQEPQAPFPYATEEVAFSNPSAGLTLAGTLTRPKGTAPVPAVVLVAGSGPQDRNGTVMQHKPLLVLADYLTRRGLAVLRFDERGVGASEGTHESATTADLATDVEAAVAYLAQRPDVDAGRIGLVGHSEGGLIAPMVANRTDDVAFLVLMAAPGLPGEDILADQLERRAEANGLDGRIRAMQRGTQQRIFDVLTQEADSAAIAEELRAVMIDTRGIRGEDMIHREIERLMAPWLRYFIAYDPRPALRQLGVPVLAVAGAKDQQVASDTNLAAIGHALGASRAPHTVRELDGLNHLFQTAETGTPIEYGKIEETMAPKALDVIGDWIVAQGGLKE